MSDISDSRIAAATEYIAERFGEFKTPGLAAGIVHGDELIWSSGFGVSDLKSGKAPDESTGTDAVAIAAEVSAISEGDFSASNNATSLSFGTGSSGASID